MYILLAGRRPFNAKNNIKGKETPANIEDKDTIFDVSNTIKNTINAKAHAVGKIQMTIPKIVATPFPPLKPAQKKKIWPKSAATPKPNCKLIKSFEWWLKFVKYAKETASDPLITSIINTGIPAFLPSTLKVFVAPELPLPNSLTSIW